MEFTKMHGIGNDFIMIDDRNGKYAGKDEEIAKKLCHRHFGIGGDGVIFVRKSEKADIKMVIINSDGSYAGMCGNGLRCFVKYIYDRNIVHKDVLCVETGDGLKKVKIISTVYGKALLIDVDMGAGSFEPKSIPAVAEEEIINAAIKENGKTYNVTSLLMGVPHTVIIGKIDEFDINEGRAIEHNKMFPKGTNVNFCEVIDKNNLKVKTWERGAGPTLACGTGCCASFLAAHKTGLVDDEATIIAPGGSLNIKYIDGKVHMIGGAEEVFNGTTNLYEE